MKRYIILVVIGFVFAALYLLRDYLPPRTAIKAARIHSGLDIQKSSVVLVFKENYSFTGEGEIEIKLQLGESEINSILQDIKSSEFKKINIDNLISDGFLNSSPQYGFNMPNTDLRQIQNGYYKLRVRNMEKLDFTMTVIDLDKKELIIWTIIP